MRIFPLALAALVLSVPVTAAETPARVTVTLANFSFTPADLHLHAGQTVTIHFVNEGSGGHDFTAPEFFAAAAMDAANRTRVEGGKGRVSLGKGESSDVTLTPKAGTYKVHCSHFGHSTLGMTGKVIVD
ncbi:cupredoxin domain-containing protein [Sphingopyxis sp. BSN-002]|uniref:cupredoxin domain-containing protein n=1 Tax=Sphingopyxis sp. BSN-002 TaxID=2911495 RepID=UPI001EDAE79E|nr:cupredoxin domain-containing protein [Sphingopyxis sp. BSN-002]UKK85471.1 cupredoxin domain-containing protein [Sphingopyxis sp. BSN-002]